MSEAEVLFEGQLTATSAAAFTVSTGQQVRVTSIDLVNITGSAATARIDRVPAGGSDGTTEEIYNGSVAANASVLLPSGGESVVVDLRPGDALWVSSGTASAIDCTISGESAPI